jgi:hypothetical protein
MIPTLEQAAIDIAEQRRQQAKSQFEATYAELLPALRGSKMTYQVAINHWGSLEIIFSKPGLSKVVVPLEVGGKAGTTDRSAQHSPESLTTLLADHIVTQEAAIEKAGVLKERIKACQRGLAIFLGLLSAIVALAVIVEMNGIKSPYIPATLSLSLFVLFPGIMYFAFKLGNTSTKYNALIPALPSWFH